MNLREILEAMVEVEEAITISSPYPRTIKRSYLLLPGGEPELPCFMHWYRPIVHALGPNGNRARDYEIRQQLFVGLVSSEPDVKGEIVLAFDEAISVAFAAAVKLHDPAVYLRRQDEEQDFMPALLEWRGKGYVALEYHYRVTTHDTVTISA